MRNCGPDQTDIQFAKSMNRAFKNAPVLSESITVYRGIRKEYNPDWMSYVLDRRIALSFAGNECCLLVIIISPGSKILPLYGISDVSHEREILIPPKGKFLITNITKGFSGIKIYDVVYVPPETIVVNEPIQFDEPQHEFDKLFYINRLLNIVTQDAIDLFGLEDAVRLSAGMIGDVPEEAIQEAIKRFS